MIAFGDGDGDGDDDSDGEELPKHRQGPYGTLPGSQADPCKHHHNDREGG